MALNLSVRDESGNPSLPTFADFMAASAEERNAYLTKPFGNITGPQAAAYNLRNITMGGGNEQLTPDQYRSILSSSGLDADTQQSISGQFSGVLQDQARASADNSLNRNALLAGGLFLGGGLALDAALAGGAAAGGATAAGGASAGEAFAMPAAIAETPSALTGMGLVETAPGIFAAGGAAGAAGGAEALAGTEALAGPATGTTESAPVVAGAGAPEVSMLSAASPTLGLSPETAAALGLGAGDLGGVGTATAFDTAAGVVPGGAPTFGSGIEGFGSGGEFAGETTGQFGGATGMGVPGDPSLLDQSSSLLKKMGLTPATAGLLGISGMQALSKPKPTQAQKDLQTQAGPAAAQANTVISSGGTGGPQWAGQKAAIDSTIDQQLQQQIQAMTQQAINSGEGADSQVTQQQINKLKDQLETQRQQLYLQAQANNVDAALRQLGISDQALASVSQTQFAQSNEAKQGAAQTASLALMLAALGKNG